MQGSLTEKDIAKNSKFTLDIAQNMSHTIDDFMNFNKTTNNTLFYISNAVEKTLQIVMAQFQFKSIAINININKGLTVLHNINAIEHCLLNILMNARDAFEENQNIEKREINIYTKKEGTYISLIVEDNAGGIPQDIIGKIFNPYFTTKKQGKGTGLGLYMAKQMLETLGQGSISAESKDTKTTVTIKFHNT